MGAELYLLSRGHLRRSWQRRGRNVLIGHIRARIDKLLTYSHVDSCMFTSCAVMTLHGVDTELITKPWCCLQTDFF